ncbi:MAG: succinylglutamate desuccinylase/aspartoacylase family protein [Pseudomonadales bacterium]|jgi:hypothetical protein|nr:succinylglutamate desuccinylase/aspartoacylase family protein [Pseudomonadales bacterium]MDP7146850.1 succinylglutamate desuccinylase/aspartoacylase family protein [Pseudomonadales bacterium]MDP7358137.1 succinylglutamate desuccinylase/aspartoacylase family protein [Pseudomonadales bacterium]MDP7594491.1 succinylglutamate desuccinylase/aspartoacylase family protein [Pseudomonadales bacterium]|tara:strand:- start:162 stop:1211 length:1050 start_codon:yes stop_codon:yes gene_type:complete
MPHSSDRIKFWDSPRADAIGADHIEFLKILAQPTWITIKGRDSSRLRTIITLLHGNEPSGLKAMHHYLKSAATPCSNVAFFIASVDAALFPPLLSHRFLPNEKDLNRCFAPPYDDSQGRLAAKLLDLLKAEKPEAVIDIHNTSSHSEPFAVARRDCPEIRKLTSLFTDKLVIITKEMGTVLEQDLLAQPILTVEFGGIMDPKADQLAIEGLERFVSLQQLSEDPMRPLQLLPEPIRLELQEGCSISFASTASAHADVTLPNTLDQLNFARVTGHTTLGWLGNAGMSALKAEDADGTDVLSDLFIDVDGLLVTRTSMTLFMVTTDPHIAKRDCILYLIPASEPDAAAVCT